MKSSKHEAMPSPTAPEIERIPELGTLIGILRRVEPGDPGYLIAVLDSICPLCHLTSPVYVEVPDTLGPRLEELQGQNVAIGLIQGKYIAARTRETA